MNIITSFPKPHSFQSISFGVDRPTNAAITRIWTVFRIKLWFPLPLFSLPRENANQQKS